MDRVAVFVDAGYVFAQGSVLLAGRKLPRAEISFSHDEAVKASETSVQKFPGFHFFESIGMTGHRQVRQPNI